MHKRQLLNDGTTKAQRRDEVSVLGASAGEVDCTDTHVRVDVRGHAVAARGGVDVARVVVIAGDATDKEAGAHAHRPTPRSVR